MLFKLLEERMIIIQVEASLLPNVPVYFNPDKNNLSRLGLNVNKFHLLHSVLMLRNCDELICRSQVYVKANRMTRGSRSLLGQRDCI